MLYRRASLLPAAAAAAAAASQRNAIAQFNIMCQEDRRVAAALIARTPMTRQDKYAYEDAADMVDDEQKFADEKRAKELALRGEAQQHRR